MAVRRLSRRPFPSTLMLEALEDQLLRRENDEATVYEGRRRSFRDLDLYSCRLSEVLRVPPDSAAPPKIAACIADADDMVLGFLAALRLSTCYAPICASSSHALLASVVEELRPWCVLVDSGTGSRLSQNQRTLNIEEYLREESPSTPKSPLKHNGSPGCLMTRQACTRPLQILDGEASGRCSLRPERCLSRQWEWKEWPATELETVAVLDDVDSARFWEDVLSTLCSGSTVALAAEEERRSASALLKFLTDTSATRVEMTPDRLWALLKRASLEQQTPLPRLRLVKCSRGLVTTQLAHLFHRVLPHCRLAYVYEHAGHCCVYKCPAEIGELRHHSIANGDFVVLGQPVGDCQVVVRDAGLSECPQGVAGAICLDSIRGGDVVVTGDSGFVDTDGYIVLTSLSTPRIDGRKVDVDMVSQCLKGIPAVSDSELCWEDITHGHAALVAFYWSEVAGDRSGELLHHLTAKKLRAGWLPQLFPLGPPPPTDQRPDQQTLLKEYSAAVDKLLSCDEANVLRGAPVLVGIARSLGVPVAHVDVNASYSCQVSGTGAASAAEASALLEHIGYEVSVDALEGPSPVSKLVESAACSLVLPGPRRMRVSLLDADTGFDEVSTMLASSFTTKNRLDTTVGNTEDQHLGNLRHLWPQIVADAASQLVHDESGRLAAVAICCDFGSEFTLPENISEAFLAILEVNEWMERPLRAATSGRGRRMLLWFMVGSSPENKRDDNIALVQLLLAHTLYDAKRLGYAGVCSINSHVVTNMVTQQWFAFDVFDEAHVADFEHRGRRPFASIRQGTLITSVYKFLERPSSS